MVAFEFFKHEFALIDSNRMQNQKRIAVTAMSIRYYQRRLAEISVPFFLAPLGQRPAIAARWARD